VRGAINNCAPVHIHDCVVLVVVRVYVSCFYVHMNDYFAQALADLVLAMDHVRWPSY